YSIEKRRQQRIENLRQRGRSPAALGDEPVRIGQRQYPGLEFWHQLGNVLRALGGLREQRQQLGKQIAGTVAQFADHQLMTLIQLAALDRSRDHVGDRSKKRDVVLAEIPPSGGMD